MLSSSDLKELLDYSPEYPVVSLYLNTDPTRGAADHYRLRLRGMLKDIDLKQDVQAIERFFNHEYDWAGRSVAVFSCAPEGFFRSYGIAVPARSRIRVTDRPHVKPLADLLDSFGGYGVALVDKQSARLFHFHLGELREAENVLGEDVRKTKLGGGSQAPGRRGGIAGLTKHTEEVAERNMREAAEHAGRFFSRKKIRRILIGGTEDNVAVFQSMLPKSWQSLIVGTFPISMTASHGEVLARAMEIGHKAQKKRELQLVTGIVTAAAKGQSGVIRLEDTLSAVHEGRVKTLVLQEGFQAPGFRCEGCGYLTVQEIQQCPFCSHAFEEIEDAVEMAVRRVMQDGGEVEVLHENADLRKAGNIGALLRY